MTTLVKTTMTTPVGELCLVGTEATLVAVLWPSEREGRVRFESEPVEGDTATLQAAMSQLDEYFAGERTCFDLALEPRGTEFQRQVWEALRKIPYAETSTYGKQAAEIGRPTAVRAVGSANGRNPLSIVVPCHRIVGVNGALTGFAGGVETKRWLLEHEQRVAAG